jgi:hypothetical protein
VIGPPTTPARRPVWQQRLQLFPLDIGQIMAIMHRRDLPHPSPKIWQTRLVRALRATSVVQLRNIATRLTSTVPERLPVAGDVRKQPLSTDLPAVRDEGSCSDQLKIGTLFYPHVAVRRSGK